MDSRILTAELRCIELVIRSFVINMNLSVFGTKNTRCRQGAVFQNQQRTVDSRHRLTLQYTFLLYIKREEISGSERLSACYTKCVDMRLIPSQNADRPALSRGYIYIYRSAPAFTIGKGSTHRWKYNTGGQVQQLEREKGYRVRESSRER